MTNTNELNAIAELADDDQFRVWDKSLGGEAAATLATLATYIATKNGTTSAVTQYAAPNATGFSVTVSKVDSWLVLTPLAGYAAGTIVLPVPTSTGQEVLVNCTQSVAALTLDGGEKTVTGAPTALAANDYFRLRYEGVTGVWYRVG